MDLGNREEITPAIYAAWKKRGDAEPPRRYLGASICGHECDRFLWNAFRGLIHENWEGRMYRLFDRGRREEDVFVSDLRSIGCNVFDRDPQTGEQFGVSAFGGHFRGHMDGVGQGIPGAPKTTHVLEFKTHCDASFRKLVKEGVELSKPMHYAQMQAYMGLSKLTRALYLAVNKDTDELYAERVEFDLLKARQIMARAKRIIESNEAPPKCADRETDYRCRLCGHADLCWNTRRKAAATKHVDCRNCCHATPVLTGDDGTWTCEITGKAVDVSFGATCDRHLLLPSIVNATLADAGENWIRYQTANGTEFVNGADGFTSRELAVATIDALLDPAVNTARQIFGGEIQGVISKEDVQNG